MIQRFDPIQYHEMSGSGHGRMVLDMKEDELGDYVKYEDYLDVLRKAEAYKKALDLITTYDKHSKFGEGICPYGCDCPHIAQEALK